MSLDVSIAKQLPGFRLEVELKAAAEAPVALLGASGSGKTMTLRCIAGLEAPTKGHIVLKGRTLFDSAQGIDVPSRSRRVGIVFQDYALFPHLTVAENIGFGLHELAAKERTRRVQEQINRIHLEGLSHRYPHEVSGGQQQRVALARALAPGPEVLLLDEPLSALDTHLRSAVEKQLIETLATYKGITILVSHNLEEAYRLCRELVVLDHGRTVVGGPKEEIFRRPPSVAVARLTGCKNISRARAVDRHWIEALDWNCRLRVAQPVAPAVGYVGIRAHHIEFTENTNEENTFPGWLSSTSETPFRMTLYLRLHGESDSSMAAPHLQAEVFKEKWAELERRPFPWQVRLDSKRLFLLPE